MNNKKSLVFTVEINGLELPEKIKQEISRELNRFVVKKLGELDLSADKAVSKSVFALIDLINGGRFYKINDRLYRPAINKLAKELKIEKGEINLIGSM
jgi:hypothetical protein